MVEHPTQGPEVTRRHLLGAMVAALPAATGASTLWRLAGGDAEDVASYDGGGPYSFSGGT